MSKILPFCLFFILVSCSSDSSGDSDDIDTPENAFELSLDLERSVFGIDERIVINASSNETLITGCVNRPVNGSEIKTCRSGDIGNGFQVNLSFPTIGTKTFTIEAQTSDGKVSKEQRQVQIDSLTNTVRITKVVLNTYPNKGKAFDPGDSDTDPDRLADLYFQITKWYVGFSVGNDGPVYGNLDLPISQVHENESSFEWIFEGNEMLFSIDNILLFKLFDLDGEPSTSEHFTDWTLDFRDFSTEKPGQINIDNYGGSVEVTFELDWN